MSKYPGVERLPSGKIKYRGTTFAGFNKPRRSNRPEKRVWYLQKKAIKLNLSILETVLWGITIAQRHVRASRHDTQKTLRKDPCQLLTGLIKCIGQDQKAQQSNPRSRKSMLEDDPSYFGW